MRRNLAFFSGVLLLLLIGICVRAQQNTVGKPVVAVAEIRLYQLMEQYKDRKDVVFVSLTSDSKKDLNAFLKKTKFSYAFVPDQNRYMSGPLGNNIYPTHLIINKKGMIVKEVTDAEDMIRALNKVL